MCLSCFWCVCLCVCGAEAKFGWYREESRVSWSCCVGFLSFLRRIDNHTLSVSPLFFLSGCQYCHDVALHQTGWHLVCHSIKGEAGLCYVIGICGPVPFGEVWACGSTREWTDQSITALVAWRKEDWRRKRPLLHPPRSGTICVQGNIGTLSQAALGRLLRDRVELIWVFPSCSAILRWNWNWEKDWHNPLLNLTTVILPCLVRHFAKCDASFRRHITYWLLDVVMLWLLDVVLCVTENGVTGTAQRRTGMTLWNTKTARTAGTDLTDLVMWVVCYLLRCKPTGMLLIKLPKVTVRQSVCNPSLWSQQELNTERKNNCTCSLWT